MIPIVLFAVFSAGITRGDDNTTIDWSTISLDPELPPEVSFIVFTRSHPHGTLNVRHLKRNRSTYVLIHGYDDSPPVSYMVKELVNAYLSRENCNIVAVDWTSLAEGPFYSEAVHNTVKVGKALSRFLVDSSLPLTKTTLVGFSLGAHIAGIAGQLLKAEGHPVDRVVGLDPAGVGYKYAPEAFRLNPKAARTVEVVHSSGGCLGIGEPIGTRDFFPNGGTCPQPGCIPDPFFVCSHRRSYYYYAEAVRDPQGGFKGRRCPSFDDFRSHKCKENGKATKLRLFNNNTNLLGSFYFITNPIPPFIKFHR